MTDPTPEVKRRRLSPEEESAAAILRSKHDALGDDGWRAMNVLLDSLTPRLDRMSDLVSQLGERLKAEERKSKHWRDQCPVTDEHVETDGATMTHHSQWCVANGVEADTRSMVGHGWNVGAHFVREPACHPDHMAEVALGNGMSSDPSEHIAVFINRVARVLNRPAHDILAEMAAIEVPT